MEENTCSFRQIMFEIQSGIVEEAVVNFPTMKKLVKFTELIEENYGIIDIDSCKYMSSPEKLFKLQILDKKNKAKCDYMFSTGLFSILLSKENGIITWRYSVLFMPFITNYKQLDNDLFEKQEKYTIDEYKEKLNQRRNYKHGGKSLLNT